MYAVNGDCYVGQWKDNMKHGELGDLQGLGSIESGPWRVMGAKEVAGRACRGHKLHQQGPQGVNSADLGQPGVSTGWALQPNSALTLFIFVFVFIF